MSSGAKVKIIELALPVNVGWSADEREKRQLIVFDLELKIDSLAACVSDELNETVDYTRVVGIISELVEGRSWRLLEKLCADLALAIFNAEERVGELEISAQKKILANVKGFQVELKLKRSQISSLTLDKTTRID